MKKYRIPQSDMEKLVREKYGSQISGTNRIEWVRSSCPSDKKIIDIGGNNGHIFYGDGCYVGHNREKVTTVDLDVYDIPNFVQADAAALPFPDDSFDIAVLAEILEHVEDPAKVLREARRVAKKLVITVPFEHCWSEDKKPLRPLDSIVDKPAEARKGNPSCKKFYTDDNHDHLFHRRFFTPESFEKLLFEVFTGLPQFSILEYDGWWFLCAVIDGNQLWAPDQNASKRPTIALVSMVKNEEKTVRKMIESALPIVDEVCILDTGSTDSTLEIVDYMVDNFPSYKWTVKESPWKNFVDSHNEALSLPTSDYVLIMHADEVLTEGHHILKDIAKRGIPCVSAIIKEGVDGQIINQYPRPRLWKNDGSWKYNGPGTHEYLAGPVPSVFVPGVTVQHSHETKTIDDLIRRGEENARILAAEIEKDPNNARARFYLARTFKDLGRRTEAVEEYERYLCLPGITFKDEQWQAAYDIAVCHKALGEHEQAHGALDLAVSIDMRRSEAYVLKGEMFFNEQCYEQALAEFKKAVRDIPPDCGLFLNPQAYSVVPLDWLNRTEFKLNRFRDAQRHSRKAVQLSGYDDRLSRNNYWSNLRANRNIFMALGPTPEPVFGGILNTVGVHGVETTYIELSEFLSDRGHNVFLFCECEDDHVYNGVYYVPWQKLEKFRAILPDVVIASRWFQPLVDCPKDAKKIVWLQDATQPVLPQIVPFMDAIVFSSPWHRHFTAELFREQLHGKRVEIIPLGIRTELFHDKLEKDPLRVIYSSSPDRGLVILGDFWPEISERVPGINLTITYGWDCADACVKVRKDQAFEDHIGGIKKDVTEKFGKFNNVRFTGRLTKSDLAKEALSASLCLYPCSFYETFCITGLEMQASGTPMVTTLKGALATTLNHDGNVLIGGYEGSQFYRDAFINETVRLLTDGRDDLEKMQAICRRSITHENDWETIAEKWEDFIYGI